MSRPKPISAIEQLELANARAAFAVEAGAAMALHCQERIVRVERALKREEKYLHSLVHSKNGPVMQGDIEGAFHRIRKELEWHRRAPKARGAFSKALGKFLRKLGRKEPS